MQPSSKARKLPFTLFRRALDLVSRSPSPAPSSSNGGSSTSLCSPLPSLQGAGGAVWTDLASALQALHRATESFPPLASAIALLAGCLEALEPSERNRKEYQAFASELTNMTVMLGRHMTDSKSMQMSQSIANLTLSVKRQVELIQARLDRGRGRRLMEAGADRDDLLDYYRKIESLFRQLQIDATLSTWSLANEQAVTIRLEGLAPAKLATYNSKLSTEISRRACTEHTRTQVLSELDAWSCDPDGADVYWMNGMAGTGKTTIAYSFAKRLEERKQLAASFFCTRTSAECRDVDRIVPTIAYQLARYSVPFQSALCETLGEDPDVASKVISKQFERLLKEPLLKSKEAMPGNLVVIIDALDECQGTIGTKQVLDALLQWTADLPIKFFVASRPEPTISNRIDSGGQSSHTVMYLHNIEESLVQADIELYLKEELASASLSPFDIQQLAERSGKLFIYAATLSRYIKPSHDPQKRLQAVLSMSPQLGLVHAEIDQLYIAILTEAFAETTRDPDEIEVMRLALCGVLCVQEPVTMETLAKLVGVDPKRMFSALRPVQSVVQFSGESEVVSTLHASFPDFMLDPTRSLSFFCNSTKYHSILTKGCFEIMNEQLRFNICNLESSFIPDLEVPDLRDRVSNSIAPALSYSCCYWGYHLKAVAFSSAFCALLKDFLSIRFLFWMEVLNLKRHWNMGLESILRSKSWMENGLIAPDILKLLNDARDFATSFASNPISQCTAHIYISALPLCAKSSSISQLYGSEVRGTIAVTGTRIQTRETPELGSWNIGRGYIRSLVNSSDGSSIIVANDALTLCNVHDGTLTGSPFRMGKIVACSPCGALAVAVIGDNSMQVWNIHDGALVGGLLTGRAGDNTQFSPDGTYIATRYSDAISVWNIHSGARQLGPYSLTPGSVGIFTFSSDGTRIISSSGSSTICIWSAQSGLPAANFSCSNAISLACSPDGTRIAAGTRYGEICLWNAGDNSLIATSISPRASSDSYISVVVFSPDSTRIASTGSHFHPPVSIWNARDGTLISTILGERYSPEILLFSLDSTRIFGSYGGSIRIWSAHGGRVPPIHSHYPSNGFDSATYSPDNTQIISSSQSNVLRIWNADDGTLTGGPVKGYPSAGISMPVSPDSKRIIVLTDDKRRFQILHTNAAVPVAEPSEGHTSEITSIVYSPDGKRIVSASQDNTIRVWSAHNGTPIGGPIEGHTSWVHSVSCSPDGTRIVSTSGDHTIRVWTMPPYESVSEDGRVGPRDGIGPTKSSLLYDWRVQPDGWVTNNDMSHRLFWVPRDLTNIFPAPHNPLVITPRGTIQVNYDNILIGERWRECYKSC